MPHTETASLIIKTYTAGGALPVANTIVRIKGADDENSSVSYSLVTDIDGITPRITLPSPPKLYSLSPKNEKLPYSLYDIEVTKEGYYTKRIHNVALFSGTDSLQPVNMIPVAVYGNGAAFPRDTLNSTVSENPYL